VSECCATDLDRGGTPNGSGDAFWPTMRCSVERLLGACSAAAPEARASNFIIPRNATALFRDSRTQEVRGGNKRSAGNFSLKQLFQSFKFCFLLQFLKNTFNSRL
jgi:hypothetical protein